MADDSPRRSRLEIELGDADVELIRIEATEGLSQQFHIEVDILSVVNANGGGEIDLLPHLGKPALVGLFDADGAVERHFHGVLVDGEFLRHDDDVGFFYRLTLRPQTHLLEQRRNFRIFQQDTVSAILGKMLDGFDTKLSLNGTYPARKYCVQYDESDFGFISRLMEEAGIYYYYEHTAGGHKMILVDSSSAHEDGTVTPIEYNPSSIARTGDIGFVASAWQERVSTGAEAKVTMRDYDFQRSKTLIEAEATDELKHPDDRLEVYAYPGRFYDNAVGKTHASALLESRRATRKIYSGESRALGISVGTKFALESHEIDRYNAPYLVTQTHHEVLSEQFRSDGGVDVADGVRFQAIPADVQFRAPLTSRRPVVAGPETGLVIGKNGKEIWCDEYGRVKVQFHWDRDGKQDDSAGCWIRVAQTGHLGNIILPRIGQEVLVDFINGDPDRPIIVGRVFNDEHKPLYALPDNETRAVWRSQSIGKKNQAPPSSPTEQNGWSPTGGNEITLEDKAGAEEVMIRAELDMNTYVTQNDKHYVGKDRTEKVIGDETITIDGGQTVTIAKDQKITVKGGIDITATSHITLTCGGSTITMKPGSIEIKTPQLTMEGTATAELKSVMTTINGTATVKMTGGMVLINS